MKIAPHQRQPTFSPKKIAAAIVIANGKDCRIAVTLASGMYLSAVRKVTIVPISANIRILMSHLFFAEYFCRKFLVISAKINSAGKLTRPLKKIAWKKSISANSNFMTASLRT